MRKWPDAHFIRHLSFGNSEILLANSLQAHKEVMQTKADKFVKPGSYETLLGEFAGKGVMFSVGEEHRLQRRFLAGKFIKVWKRKNSHNSYRAILNSQYSQIIAHISE